VGVFAVRVLVTGATGYVGRAVVSALRTRGHEPVALVRTPGARVADAAEIRVADLLDGSALRRALAGGDRPRAADPDGSATVGSDTAGSADGDGGTIRTGATSEAAPRIDAVCHLAALARARESFLDPLRCFAVNTTGTLTLLEAMSAAGVRGLVFASTGSVYGSPGTQPMTEDLPVAPPHPYAASKFAAELAVAAQCRTGALGAIVLRMLNVAGGDDPDPTRLVPRAVAAAAGEGVLTVNGDGCAVRDYLHPADAAEAFVAAVERLPEPGRVRTYNIGSGVGRSVTEIVAAVEAVAGRPVPVAHRAPADEPRTLVCDPSAARRELGWWPHRSDIETIVRDAWAAHTPPPTGAASDY